MTDGPRVQQVQPEDEQVPVEMVISSLQQQIAGQAYRIALLEARLAVVQQARVATNGQALPVG
jgi:hypothetical protein